MPTKLETYKYTNHSLTVAKYQYKTTPLSVEAFAGSEGHSRVGVYTIYKSVWQK